MNSDFLIACRTGDTGKLKEFLTSQPELLNQYESKLG